MEAGAAVPHGLGQLGTVVGAVLNLEANKKGRANQLRASVQERPLAPPAVPAFDVRAMLQKLWRYAEDQPQPYTLDDSAGPV